MLKPTTVDYAKKLLYKNKIDDEDLFNEDILKEIKMKSVIMMLLWVCCSFPNAWQRKTFL